MEKKNGLPLPLKAGIERLSGFSMDDVRVHSNSPEPARFGAHAFARGTNIHLGSGQEQHLPHEAWHVVQQKQGRVQPTQIQAHGVQINDDTGLEREADQMGVKALSNESGTQYRGYSSASPLIQQQIMQRKKVATDYGEFETTKFDEVPGKGVEIILKFHPNEDKVDAKKIALSQSVRKTTEDGTPYAIDPNQLTKMVGSGKTGEGYAIDRLTDFNNPIYGADDLDAAKTLADTPMSNNTSTKPTELGPEVTYELGYCYKEKKEDDTKKKHSAGLYDRPVSNGKKGRSKMFETTAFAIDGADAAKDDPYYGSIKWGFSIDGTEEEPKFTRIDIDLVSTGTPGVNFTEAAKLWNDGKAQGTLRVKADPAIVLSGGTSEPLIKGTKLKQKRTVIIEGKSMLEAEVLNDAHPGSGKIVFIKNIDVEDIGDGKEIKHLPIKP